MYAYLTRATAACCKHAVSCTQGGRVSYSTTSASDPDATCPQCSLCSYVSPNVPPAHAAYSAAEKSRCARHQRPLLTYAQLFTERPRIRPQGLYCNIAVGDPDARLRVAINPTSTLAMPLIVHRCIGHNNSGSGHVVATAPQASASIPESRPHCVAAYHHMRKCDCQMRDRTGSPHQRACSRRPRSHAHSVTHLRPGHGVMSAQRRF